MMKRLAGLILVCSLGPGIIEAAGGVASYLEGLAPEGWRIKGAVEVYTPATLYEKIDGRSELYLSYDVASMGWVALAAEGAEGAGMEIQLFDMRTPLAAFGVFSMERSRGAAAVSLGREGYRESGNVFFWKGPFYATLRDGETRASPRPELLAAASRLAARLADDGSPLWGKQRLPAEGLIADSVQYFMGDALALDFMTDTFTAVYARPDGEITAFLSHQADAEAARATCGKFSAFLVSYADGLERTTAGGTEFSSAETGDGRFDVVFQLGEYVAGVTTVPGRDRALAAATALRDQLRTAAAGHGI